MSAAVEQLDAELQTSRQDSDFQRFDIQQAQFGDDSEPALLGHHQPFAIRTKERSLHGGVGGVQVNADTLGLLRRRGAGEGMRPSMKSVGAAGMSKAFQRNRLGLIGPCS